MNGTVRVVFCTIAFGMGVHVKGANLALHFGPSSCLDDYLQEVVKIGRSSDKNSHSVLLGYKGCARSKNINDEMKEYVRNNEVCRRSLLMQPFLDGIFFFNIFFNLTFSYIKLFVKPFSCILEKGVGYTISHADEQW